MWSFNRQHLAREWEVFTNTSSGRLQKGIPANNVSFKLWIAETLSILYGANPKDVSSIIPQIYRCDATKLFLYGQILTYNEFLFFSRNVKILHLNSSRVKNGNGIVATNENNICVPLEKLVKTLVNLKKIFGEIDPSHSCITSNTVKELLEIPHFSKIDEFTLYKIPEVFDIDTFFIYLNKNKYTEFYLYFAGSISEEYKVRLEKIVDEILQTETHNFKLPWIYFDGLAEEKKRKMRYINERFSRL
uniref:Uncharacterized protein n=1 Tax=Panagrolaimus davidi TaxID=227884 RepID=A0A914PSA6_9BILA